MSNTTRRTLLTGAGAAGLAAALAGCAAYGDTGTDTAAPAPAGGDTGGGATGATGATGAGGAPAGGGGGFAKTSDIPVGGGKIFEDQKIVVTQPTAGQFKCFTAVCTHAGCVVGDVSGGTINCPCHGSKFKVADGSVANGPASKALKAVAIKVDGDAISKA
ncbi:Rieske (2Fe-2S) protein [Dactylosporangium aurantiacum]|uniref:Cytochrome bc1 complex Rieske iron-sulfur subunit n=1 Tax=Dactylosporangium aurantiacum TaxID=35754 RepID=A0A9Q9MCZ7_9ACTN|nr:Rieske (2Fe-2S) protein [Dactylosporangium aurantiacum]MDG6109048.1 Rieske (2Fe-2S) protein [Dactylosporangium aurantiacum]UWZ54548.1 Rieske (2Fe-2S) protein [Dactylosporangium aurantiacum]